MKFPRQSGIICHPTSLPSEYGIGDLGDSSYEFINFLQEAGQKIWQVLPLGPTGYGDSPYQCFSAFAGNHYLISPDNLVEIGLLHKDDIIDHPDFPDDEVDYAAVINWKMSILEKAFSNFYYHTEPLNKEKIKFKRYCRDNDFWLDDYALFMSVKEYYNHQEWEKWDTKIANNEKEAREEFKEKLKDRIQFQKWMQYIFFNQWENVKYYANQRQISIIGDLPIFVAYDSADLWANPDLFLFSYIAGVPPDYFSETGQLWGNPQYNWDRMKQDNYKWWRMRFITLLKMFDMVRIDHFRGFEASWYIPYGEVTAIKGEWVKAPGHHFFETIFNNLGEIPIIAENLGVITDEVEELRHRFNMPGMKIFQFGLESTDPSAEFLPHNYEQNTVAYTGTHDNDTSVGWFNSQPDENKDFTLRYLNSDGKNIHTDLIRALFSSSADIAIIPLQDLYGLDTEARMNYPGNPRGNWQWRCRKDMLNSDIAHKLRYITELYGR